MQSKHRDKVLNILVGNNKSLFFVGMAVNLGRIAIYLTWYDRRGQQRNPVV